MAVTDLLLQLGLSNANDILKGYIDEIANRNLKHYQGIIQTGAKSGESLYAHVLNGIFVLERIRPILGLEEVEVKILFSAYSIHDLNKLPDSPNQSFNKLATEENIVPILQFLEMEAFFPEYTDYLKEIELLVRAHSGHYNTYAETLHKKRSPYQLDKERVEKFMVAIIRAMDVIDLSKSLEEKAKKTEFLGHINSILYEQYHFVFHKIYEHRGVMTNLIHNQVAKYLEEEKGLIPVLFYPDGVSYLTTRHQNLEMVEQDWENLKSRVVKSAESKTADEFEKFIESRPAGIKIDEKCLSLGISFARIFNEVRNKISLKKYDAEQTNQKCLQRLETTLGKMEKKSNKVSSIIDQIRWVIDDEHFILPQDDDIFRLGELIRTYYSFLTGHFSDQIADVWQHVYNLLEIDDHYEPYDKLYNRAYIVGRDLANEGVTFDHVYDLIVGDGSQILSQAEVKNEFAVLADYVEEQIDFTFDTGRSSRFTSGLSSYIGNNHKQCSSCGSQFETDKWMKGDVPASIKVQYFTNRLEGGSSREPKRMICQLCRVQYVLDKICYQALGNTKTLFAHLYPCSFFTDTFIHAFRGALTRIKDLDFGAILLKTEQVFRDYQEKAFLTLTYAGTKVNGNPLPKFSEALGNILTIPINAPGDNDTDKMLFALSNALIYQRFLGCRVVLTESSIPVFAGNEFDHFFIDNIPTAFQSLIRHNDLNSEGTQELFEKIRLLYEIKSKIVILESRDFLKLIRSIGEHPLEIYHVVHTLIRKKEEQFRLGTIRKTANAIEKLALEQGGNQIVSHIKELAQIAWEGRLRGDSLKDNSLAKALDVALDCIDRWNSDWESEEEAVAVMSKEIARAIERLAPQYFGKQKLEHIDRFVDIFFGSIYKEVYKGNRFDFIGNRKRIRSAYLHFISQQIGSNGREEQS